MLQITDLLHLRLVMFALPITKTYQTLSVSGARISAVGSATEALVMLVRQADMMESCKVSFFRG